MERGFEETLNGPKRTYKPTPNIPDGGQEVQVITMRLLARKVVDRTSPRTNSAQSADSAWTAAAFLTNRLFAKKQPPDPPMSTPRNAAFTGK